MTEREQLQYLWKVLDQLHSTALGVTRGHLSSDGLPGYVLRKTQEAMQAVPYPGEPPESLNSEAEN